MPSIQQIGTLTPEIFAILLVAVLIILQVSVRNEFQRRKFSADPAFLSTIAIISGLVLSKLAYAISFPSQSFDHPLANIFRISGGNFYVGLLAGSIDIFVLSRLNRLPTPAVLDILSPTAACFAIFEPIPSLAPVWWPVVVVLQSQFFGRPSSKPRPDGLVFSIFLALIGAARFLVGYITRDTSTTISPTWPQTANLACFTLGMILFAVIKSRFHKLSKEHRILDDAQQRGLAEQPESKSPTPECPHPERWRMYDAMTAEVEVLEFLKTLITTVKPNLVVETGTFMGVSTLWIAEGLKQNGFGRVITCEFDPKTHAAAKKRFDESGLAEWIDLRLGSSLDLKIEDTIDILFSDSDLNLREKEVRRFLPQINSNGIILMHDASSHLKVVREAALRLEQEGLISMLLLPTPRGLVIAQKRAGRK